MSTEPPPSPADRQLRELASPPGASSTSGGSGGGGRGPGPVSKLFDRLPPQALEAEMSLLGSMILDSHVVGEVVQVVAGSADFYQTRHATLYDTLVQLYDQNVPIDLVQLRQHLSDHGTLEQVGGVQYLLELAESVPSATSAAYYARIVRDKAVLRRLIDAAGEILHKAYTSPDAAAEQVDAAEREIFRLAEARSSADPQALGELLQETFAQLEAREGQHLTGLETGFFELDEMTSGLQKGEMIVIAGRPSMGKCLTADAEIVGPDGMLLTIEQAYQQRRAELLTLSDDLKLNWTAASAFVDDGVKPVAAVTTALGRSVTATFAHPFLTPLGWRRLEELKPGDCVAVPRQLPAFGRDPMPEHRIKLLAYLLGDGNLTNACPRFTSNSAALRDDFTAAVRDFGGLAVRECSSGGTRAVSLSVSADRPSIATSRTAFGHQLRQALRAAACSNRQLALQVGVSPATITNWCDGKTAPPPATVAKVAGILSADCATALAAPRCKNAPNPLTSWLSACDLMGCSAHSKFVPAPIFRLPQPQLALFLNRLFATDGWATVLASGQSQLGYGSVSRRLARQVQHLLLRFGVIASLRRRSVLYRSTRRSAYQLDITDARSIRNFIDRIGIFGKEGALGRVVSALDARRYQTNCDLIPREIWSLIDRARGSRTWADVAEVMGFSRSHNLHVGRRALSRDRLWRFAVALDSQPLRALATSDVFWDRIVAITPAGNQQVYDLTIPVTHNFIANDICVHNTAFALNIAEHVAATNKQPVAVFSLEMSRQQLAQRLLCSRSGVDSHRMRRNILSQDEYARLALTVGELSEAPLFIDDAPGLSLLQLRARARRMAVRHDIKAVILDYLQLMGIQGAESRQQEVSELSRGIKALARELNVPVLCLSQLNRAPEAREGHRPRMADLRESGSIEQDADVVMMLHREDYYHSEPNWAQENPDKVGTAELIIAKQRNGPTGTVNLQFNSQTTRFNNLASSGSSRAGSYSASSSGGSSLQSPASRPAFHHSPPPASRPLSAPRPDTRSPAPDSSPDPDSPAPF